MANKDTSQTMAEAAANAAALVKSTADATATALNIQYLARDVAEIKALIKDLPTSFTPKLEFDPLKEMVLEMKKQHEAETEEMRSKVEDLQRNIAMGMGGLGVLVFLVPIILKVFFKW